VNYETIPKRTYTSKVDSVYSETKTSGSTLKDPVTRSRYILRVPYPLAAILNFAATS